MNHQVPAGSSREWQHLALRRVLSGEAECRFKGRGAGLDKRLTRCAGREPGWQPLGPPRHPSNGCRYSLPASLSNLLDREEHRGSDTRITQGDSAQKQDLPWERPLLTRVGWGEALASGGTRRPGTRHPAPPAGDRLNEKSRTAPLEQRHTRYSRRNSAVGKGG